MNPLARLTLPAALALLAACTSDAPPPEPREEDRALERAVQAPQDKARAVEDELQKAKEAQDAKIQEQGG